MQFDHQDPGLRQDTLRSLYADLAESPVTWSDQHGGFWMVTGFDAVRAVATDWETFSSGSGVFVPDAGPRLVALEQDPPAHRGMRGLYAKWIGGVVRRPEMRESIVELTRHHVGEFSRHGGGDFVAGVSERLPVEIICHTVGLNNRAVRLRELSAALAHDDIAAVGELFAILADEIAERRASPRADVLSDLLAAEVDGSPMSDQLAADWMAGALLAGHETTLLASAGLAWELARSPTLQRRLRADPTLIRAVVDEALRMHGPALVFFRTVTRDTECAGVPMTAGDKVGLMFGAASVDPAVFDDPADFQPDREFQRHLAFGHGIHRCVGAPLALLELTVLVEVLLEHDLDITGTVEYAEPTGRGAFVGLRQLPIGVSPISRDSPHLSRSAPPPV